MDIRCPKKWRSIRTYKSIQKTYTINPETGEYGTKTRFVDKIFSKRGYIFKYNNGYIKLFLDKGLPDECSLVDCGRFYRLTRYIVGENQLLGYRSDKLKPLTIEKMSEIFNCGERQVRRFIKQMKECGVIKEVTINETKWYAVNPLYALKSKYLSLTTFIIFQNELIPVLPSWVVNNFTYEAQELTDIVKIKE